MKFPNDGTRSCLYNRDFGVYCIRMNERSIISVRGVSKYFGDVHAVDNVDLEIRRGEFFSLLGP